MNGATIKGTTLTQVALKQVALALSLLLIIAVGACQPARVVTVLAAASLTESFDEIIEAYRAEHPGVEVRVSYGSSATLAAQVASGAPADVFASANESTMASLAKAGLDVTPEVLTTNTLQIAVPPGNPGNVTELADFGDEDRTIALCAVEVPCGKAAATLFERLGITPKPDTYEVDVKATLRKVELGEVDAALVYRTDVTSARGRVEGLPTPGAEQAVNTYLIAKLPDTADAGEAERFVAYVLSPEGQAVLRSYGFGGS
ncbi:molybdate ABC transporter substrate-binding protein [Propionibacteriaceae bacterium Y2011]